MKVDKVLLSFASNHNVKLVIDGECGFGRDCVGFQSPSGNWIDYNPCSMPDYEEIEELSNEEHYDLALEDAYHKHDCMAVLVRDGNKQEAINQLLDWVEKLNDRGVSIKPYKTGAVGVQALISGEIGYCLALR